MDRECHAIVMLGHLNENGREVCYQYWPSNSESINIGEFFISVQDETPYSGYTERTLVIQNNKTNQKQRVTQYQITDWNSDGHAQNSQNIITVMEEMYKVQRKAGSSSILVHCSDTVTRSGIFLSLIHISEPTRPY